MVDMTHDRYDRCSFYQIRRIILIGIKQDLIFLFFFFDRIDIELHAYEFDILII